MILQQLLAECFVGKNLIVQIALVVDLVVVLIDQIVQIGFVVDLVVVLIDLIIVTGKLFPSVSQSRYRD